jgi:hypothetical protein
MRNGKHPWHSALCIPHFQALSSKNFRSASARRAAPVERHLFVNIKIRRMVAPLRTDLFRVEVKERADYNTIARLK